MGGQCGHIVADFVTDGNAGDLASMPMLGSESEKAAEKRAAVVDSLEQKVQAMDAAVAALSRREADIMQEASALRSAARAAPKGTLKSYGPTVQRLGADIKNVRKAIKTKSDASMMLRDMLAKVENSRDVIETTLTMHTAMSAARPYLNAQKYEGVVERMHDMKGRFDESSQLMTEMQERLATDFTGAQGANAYDSYMAGEVGAVDAADEAALDALFDGIIDTDAADVEEPARDTQYTAPSEDTHQEAPRTDRHRGTHREAANQYA